MSKIYDEQINKMQRLINYGVNENTDYSGSKPVVEYHSLGADGKTYGIIKEGTKFFIKVAPKKDTEVISEDYDYIGGFMNKKDNEYSTYAMASKQLDLKLMALSEEYGHKKNYSQFKETEASEWQVNETKEMRKEINRYNEILNNVDNICNESENGFTLNHTAPEAPSTNPSSDKVNGPFTDTAVAKGDKDFKVKSTDHKKAGAPFNENGEVDGSDMQSTKNPKCKNSETYCEKPKYAPKDSVANQHPSGGKSVKMNEGKTVKLTEEQVLAWSKSKDFADKTNGTEIGDSDPFVEKVNEEECCGKKGCKCKEMNEDDVMHDSQDQNSPEAGTSEVGDSDPFIETVNEEENIPFSEVAGSPDEEEDDFSYEIDMPDDDYIEGDIIDDDYDTSDDEFELEYDDEMPFESKKRKSRKMNETVLNDFGKHPAYRKVPMTTLPNKEVSKSGRDWNDKSAEGEEPFGNKIGKSSPYDNIVNVITDNVMNILNKKKV